MNLQKAIKTVILDGHENPKDPFCDLETATKLLIEAGKRIQACREPEGGSPLPPLAGETKD